MKRQQEPEKENNERWLLTYSDLITLLMIFFVIMYASSNVDAQKYTQMSNSFREVFGGGKNIVGETNSVGTSTPKETINPQTDEFQNTKEEIQKIIDQNNLSDKVSISEEAIGLVVSFNDNLFFDKGKADVKEESKARLLDVAKVLKNIKNNIRVEGFTDDLPIHTKEFNSNWQLSSTRASNVTEFLVEDGNVEPTRVTAVGHGEYKPKVKNDSEENRQKNRRVDIVIVNDKYNSIGS
ncbi:MULTISPECIES: flagellar motor protein MotB [Clostridium]|uniref:OmpA family protein n=1 Tax=Clostridium paridis TaxID=2803863 RepID=A0A937FJ42_9CLOT|nr:MULTISPECIES: flagellar motor protein MotB [Clostridium]MBL4933332.1 OmpA family protein [Clostridium paridis]